MTYVPSPSSPPPMTIIHATGIKYIRIWISDMYVKTSQKCFSDFHNSMLVDDIATCKPRRAKVLVTQSTVHEYNSNHFSEAEAVTSVSRKQSNDNIWNVRTRATVRLKLAPSCVKKDLRKGDIPWLISKEAETEQKPHVQDVTWWNISYRTGSCRHTQNMWPGWNVYNITMVTRWPACNTSTQSALSAKSALKLLTLGWLGTK